MENAVRKLLDAASTDIAGSGDDLDALGELRVRYLGRKGELAQLFKQLGGVPEEERRKVGKTSQRGEARIGGVALQRAGSRGRRNSFIAENPLMSRFPGGDRLQDVSIR